MKFEWLRNSWGKFAGLLAVGLCTLALSGCGGAGCADVTCGSSSGGTGGPTSLANTVTVTLTGTGGVASNALSASNTLNATAVVRDSTGALAANQVVTFSLSNALATIAPTTALTNASGAATVSIQTANLGAGAGTVTAKTTLTGTTTELSGAANFSVGTAANVTPTPIAINFVAVSPSDGLIVKKGSGGLGQTETAILTFRVVDNSNTGINGIAVDFTTSAPVTLAATSGVTDASGNVSVSLSSDVVASAVVVTATLNAYPSIQTNSSNVTVTSGGVVQSAFSLSMKTHNPEAWSIDNTRVEVMAMLADAQGQAVSNGTSVTFTTDAGAIEGAIGGKASCYTLAGICTVTWRSQNPRAWKGTVTATANSGSITATQRFYMSGSDAFLTYTGTSAARPMNFAASCNPQTLNFTVQDLHGGPLPSGTTINAVYPTNVSVVVIGSPIPDIAPDGLGNSISAVVTPNGCKIGGAGEPVSGSFYLGVTVPSGLQTLFNVDVSPFPVN